MNQLRPLSVGEIIDVAFKLYFRNWARFAATVAVVVIPFQIIDAIIRQSTIDSVSGRLLFYTDKTAYTGGVIAIAVLSAVASLFAVAVAFRAVSQAYMGQTPAIGGSLRFAVRRLHSLLWVDVLVVLGVVLGLIALIIPGIMLYVMWAVAVPALLVEDRRGSKALGRSQELVSGHWWSTFGVLIIAALIIQLGGGFVAGLIAGLILAHASSVGVYVLIQALLGAFVQILLLPLSVAVTTVLYFDLRVRREGFDMSLMIDALNLPGGDYAPVGIAGLPAPPPPVNYPPPGGYPPPPPPGYGPPPPGYGPPAAAPGAYPPPPGPPGYAPPPPGYAPPPGNTPPPSPLPAPGYLPPPGAPPPAHPPGQAPPGWAPPVAPDVRPPEDPEPGQG